MGSIQGHSRLPTEWDFCLRQRPSYHTHTPLARFVEHLVIVQIRSTAICGLSTRDMPLPGCSVLLGTLSQTNIVDFHDVTEYNLHTQLHPTLGGRSAPAPRIRRRWPYPISPSPPPDLPSLCFLPCAALRCPALPWPALLTPGTVVLYRNSSWECAMDLKEFLAKDAAHESYAKELGAFVLDLMFLWDMNFYEDRLQCPHSCDLATRYEDCLCEDSVLLSVLDHGRGDVNDMLRERVVQYLDHPVLRNIRDLFEWDSDNQRSAHQAPGPLPPPAVGDGGQRSRCPALTWKAGGRRVRGLWEAVSAAPDRVRAAAERSGLPCIDVGVG